MNSIYIAGETGMLGKYLMGHLRSRRHDIVNDAFPGFKINRADLRSYDEVKLLLDKKNPNVIINLVGMSSVDLCEINPKLAYETNVLVISNLARWVKSTKNCYLIHISTDQVYDSLAYNMESQVNLKNIYAITKYFGELNALKARAAVFRTNFFGLSNHPTRKSFTDWAYNELVNNKKIYGFKDVLFSPLSFLTLSNEIENAIDFKPVGLFNLGSRGMISKFNFLKNFCTQLGYDQSLVFGIQSSEMVTLKARRPGGMGMNVSKYERELFRTLPTIEEELKSEVFNYRKKQPNDTLL